MKTPLLILLLLCVTSIYSQTQTITVRKETNPNLDNGKKLYRQNCAVCHSETDAIYTGPHLIGVTKRLEMKWLISWVKCSEDLIKSGDKYANEIYKQWGSGQPYFKYLSDQEIKDIFVYVDTFVPRPKKNK